MKGIKSSIPDNMNIVARNKFVANDIIPISISECKGNENNYMILFVASQDYDDSLAFLQIMVTCEDDEECDFMNNEVLNKNNVAACDKLYKTFMDIIDNMHKENLYAIDMNINEDEKHPLYYYMMGVRGIDDTHVAAIDIYIPRSVFCRLSLYLSNIANCVSSEYIFYKPDYRIFEFETIEYVKYDCTSLGTIRKDKEDIDIYKTHYTMHCGPSKYEMNKYSERCSDDPPLANPLDSYIYDKTYGDHCVVSDYFRYKDKLYIMYPEKDKSDKFKVMKVLVLSKELSDKTEFYNRDLMFGTNKEDKNNDE